MRRDQAVSEYIESLSGSGDLDTVAIRCGFCDYIDHLVRENRISEKQAGKWIGLTTKEIKKAKQTAI